MDESEKDTQIYKLSFGGIWLPLRVKATELKAYQGKLDNPWTLPDGSKLYPFKSDGHNTPKVEAEIYNYISYDMKRTKLLKMSAGTEIIASPEGMLRVFTLQVKK